MFWILALILYVCLVCSIANNKLNSVNNNRHQMVRSSDFHNDENLVRTIGIRGSEKPRIQNTTAVLAEAKPCLASTVNKENLHIEKPEASDNKKNWLFELGF